MNYSIYEKNITPFITVAQFLYACAKNSATTYIVIFFHRITLQLVITATVLRFHRPKNCLVKRMRCGGSDSIVML